MGKKVYIYKFLHIGKKFMYGSVTLRINATIYGVNFKL